MAENKRWKPKHGWSCASSCQPTKTPLDLPKIKAAPVVFISVCQQHGAKLLFFPFLSARLEWLQQSQQFKSFINSTN